MDRSWDQRIRGFLLLAPRAIMGILTVFSQPPTGVQLITFLYFATRGSMVTSEQDKVRKIEIVLFYSTEE